MSDKKKAYDKERLRLKRESETPEDRAARLDKVKKYQKTTAGKKAVQKANAKYNAKRTMANRNAVHQQRSLDKRKDQVHQLQADVRRLEREAQVLQMERFPKQIKWENGRPEKVAVAGKYAKARFLMCDMADQLAECDGDVVLSVLKQMLPIIKDKVKSLEDDLDVTSNYTCHLIDQEEKEMQ